MDALFIYFLTIGAGLATGVLTIIAPSIWIYNKIRSRKAASSKTY